MDHPEEQNSEHVDHDPAPEESLPADSSQDQSDSPEATADDAPAVESPAPSQNEEESAPVNNHSKPETNADEAGQLKTLVKERDEIIVDLRARNHDLQEKLAEKEKIVTALTSRLEQAAEQLDRLRRSGADRGGKILSGIPSEVIDEQRELINDLKSAIQHWEDLQSTSAMGRFEGQLNELREMLAEQLNLKDRIDKGGPTEAFKGTSSSSAPVTQRSSWDEMKAQLLGDSGASGKAPKSDGDSDILIPGAEPADADEEASDGIARFEEKYESEYAIDIPARPAEIENIDEADAETLKAAVKERDQHIDKLLEVIDALKEISGQGELEDSRKRQKALEEQLQKSESEMKDKLRQAEIEMSMERARLAREAARLQQIGSGGEEADLPHENGSEEVAHDAEGDEKGSRWARFLGSK